MSAPALLDPLKCPLEGMQAVEASAGTGKTWNICALYLRLVLERGLGVQQILVVSFTKAATAELRSRIRTRLSEVFAWAQGIGSEQDPFPGELLGAVQRQTGLGMEALQARLRLALEQFDEAAVLTIHGFCHRVLGDSAFSAGLPFRQELNADSGALVGEVTRDFWRRRVADAPLFPGLAQWVVEQRDSPDTWATLLAQRLRKPLARLVDLPDPASIAADDTVLELEATHAATLILWRDTNEALAAVLAAAQAGFKQNSFSPSQVAQLLSAWEGESRRLGSGLGMPPVLMQTLGKLSTSRIAQGTKKSHTPPAHPFFDAVERLATCHAAVTLRLELERLRLLYALFEEGAEALRRSKLERRLLSYDDILLGTHRALQGPRAEPLAQRLRAAYPAALVDEFQDTDPLQFQIFQAIYGAGPEPRATLFVVGDPKQAIYSFRNADLRTYLSARDQADSCHTLLLNQRSSEAMIAAVNTLFGTNPRAFQLPPLVYHPVARGTRELRAFSDTSEPEVPDAAMRLWQLPSPGGQYPTREEAQALATAAAAGEIARLLREARAGRVLLAGRALAPGEIAVLVRSHRQGARMKSALLALGVGAVQRSREDVLHCAVAGDLERLLRAVLEPSRASRLLTSLATELMGFDASGIDALRADEGALLAISARFGEYRELWQARGFAPMFRHWMAREKIALRLLGSPNGERRMTNLLHLGELLQQVSSEHAGPEALLRWLGERRADGAEREEQQLRLESDANLVQVVTIHQSKGLEYPVVFCPYLCIGERRRGGSDEGREYHPPQRPLTLDFRPDCLVDKAELTEIKALQAQERDEESLRLAYVALTRAVHRCYLVVGGYVTLTGISNSSREASRGLLNWLAAGGSSTPEDWRNNERALAEIDSAWARLAQAAPRALSLRPIPEGPGRALPAADVGGQEPRAAAPPAIPPAIWRLGSFSSLRYGAEAEGAASDHDAYAIAAAAAPPGAPLDADDIREFPRGAAAGDCLHALLEAVDFTEDRDWSRTIDRVLATHGPRLGMPAARLAPMLRRMLEDVLGADLGGGLLLNRLPWECRLVEMGFHLPAPRLDAPSLNRWLETHGYAAPRLAFGPLSGYLKGFIDLIVHHEGRYYVLDWKSNFLGEDPTHYAPAAVAGAMAEHAYLLQGLLYLVALHRLLQTRLSDYDPDRHLGGMLYVFLRGVRPGWCNDAGAPLGVYAHRPDRSTLESLDALLRGG